MDWIDILLHGGISVFAMGLFWLLKIPTFGALLNTVFWPARETIQHGHFPTSTQSTLEYVIPVVLAWLALILIYKIEFKDG